MSPRTTKRPAAPRSKARSSAQPSLPLGDTEITNAPSTRGPSRPAAVGPALRAWVDGGARGNPGPAGYGAHIEDGKGNTVRDESGFLGTTTNNVAEYNGLLAALRTAIELQASALDVFADSELVVKQMKGLYKVKNERLRPLFLKAQLMANALPRFRITHVRREDNRDADRLANEAMDRGA